METIPSANTRRSFEVQTENVRRPESAIFCYAYIAGRITMIGITIYSLTRDVLDEVKYPCHWLEFCTIYMILECSVTYSDPLWNWKCTRAVKTHIHWIFAVAALVSGTMYFSFRKNTFFSVANYNSTAILTSPNDIEAKDPWHCSYSYSLLSFILTVIFFAVFFTGIVLFASVNLPVTYIYWFHKCGGTLVTYSTILLLACDVFTWLSAPMSWIILLLTILAFVFMPVRIFSNRSVSNQ